MKRRVEVVRALPALVDCRIGAHDVVVGEDVGKPESFDALCVGTYDRGVSTKLRLREHDANAHSPFNHDAPQLLPARRSLTSRRELRAVPCHIRRAPTCQRAHGACTRASNIAGAALLPPPPPPAQSRASGA